MRGGIRRPPLVNEQRRKLDRCEPGKPWTTPSSKALSTRRARRSIRQAVHGRHRRIKSAILGITLGVYHLLPFVRSDRGPGLPNQAVLVDFPHRRFYFFFIELWPQEVYYLTGLLIIAAMILF